MMESDYDYNYNTSDDECHLWEEEEQQNEEKKEITYQVQTFIDSQISSFTYFFLVRVSLLAR